MKKMILQMRFRSILPLLVMAVLFTLPSAVTGSKYVWEDTIDVRLSVVYPDTVITSLLAEGYPSEFWVQNLTNIQATPTVGGLVLTAQEGYVLPEYITVKIGETTFSVKTDGTEAPEGLSFDPVTGLLSVSELYSGYPLALQADGIIAGQDETPEKTETEEETETAVPNEAEQSPDTVPLDQPDR